mmetsp:Transcript_51078/g.102668  ORF Transcript_51078/g.102668 Transcript_51078/m.102668 type:complete len:103 (-) Transcript_51078:84-392(-)
MAVNGGRVPGYKGPHPIPLGGAPAGAAVTVCFTKRKVVLRVVAPNLDGVTADRRAVTFCCESDVEPEKCTFKVDRAKGRVTLTLKKVSELKKWQKVTTKAMS